MHEGEGKEKDEEVRVEVKRERSKNSERNAHHGWHADDGDGLKDDLSQCGVTCVRNTNTKQCADVLTHQCRACSALCKSCHCCHCPHWS